MRVILLIFALLIAACDVKEPIPCKSVAIQFSDANPIQFWPVDCLTYNENEVCGVHSKCWCHPWECDDEIPIQFTDTEENQYALEFYNEQGSLIDTLFFENTDLNGTPEIPAIGGVMAIPSLASWIGRTTSGALVDWTTGATPTVTLPVAQSEILYCNFSFIAGYTYSITLNYTKTYIAGSSNPRTLHLQALDASFGVVQSVTETTPNTSTTDSCVLTFIALGTETRIGTYANDGSTVIIDVNTVTGTQLSAVVPAVPGTLFVNQISFIPSLNSPDLCDQRIQLKIVDRTASPDSIVYKSDCLDIKDTQDCTTLIEYSNNRNFAGLIYQGLSPEQVFRIRVPAIFFHEQFPEEDEAMELTTGIQKTSGTLKVQRLFETDYMPYYMHKKLKLIFKHQFITIDNLSWLKEEPYQISEGDRRWPVKKAKCFLTQDYIQRAVL